MYSYRMKPVLSTALFVNLECPAQAVGLNDYFQTKAYSRVQDRLKLPKIAQDRLKSLKIA